ncbi:MULTISPECIES: 3,4-dihydroxy-2-butanone-4-phosphate synthase [unclassified Rhodococcus (in: high G+C Gram-positive bacteria)]|uniref:3,4-dihydroxy-2-butanone-4-phosphate synthase n=1 Tax=unclassified Rhodococcus (in: high G+C Gram-positive bacteria) TaxID=192944 RepID=UPI00163A0C3A|nr:MULTISPECIES: 3,4-dihydroxy-2-butanone-4-phosphate synthase [unclassified Rhodococcus (in: high G+C Gram-positive bacteria)]MBC2637661.1 3,4-dihydroxy-2-butanone-4-phosphate synthase [Rhodococcus sp. 3A]MBC2897595.1 3,4-dihydroxy-2-butanone-4-phosphate synthase [Rhodococcus sp. 4CII]
MTITDSRHEMYVERRPAAADRTGSAAALHRVERATAAAAAGRALVLADPVRGETNLVLAAELASTELLAFMIRHTSGFVKVTVSVPDCERLQLPPMWPLAGHAPRCNLAVSVDAVEGVGTGISAADRAHTIRTIADPATVAFDLARPGHVVPVIAHDPSPSVLGIPSAYGAPDAVVDLMRAAGLRPLGALCELVSPADETVMADETEGVAFARRHSLAHLSILDVAATVGRGSQVLEYGEECDRRHHDPCDSGDDAQQRPQ